MVSAQFAGLVRMYAQKPSGHKTQILQQRIEDLAPAGGSSEGLPANVATPEKRVTVASPVTLVNDDILLVTFEPDIADGLDASDCIWSIPVTTPSGSNALGRSSFQNPALADQALVASREVVIAGYKVTEGQLRLGVGKIFLDVQNDA